MWPWGHSIQSRIWGKREDTEKAAPWCYATGAEWGLESRGCSGFNHQREVLLHVALPLGSAVTAVVTRRALSPLRRHPYSLHPATGQGQG